jgi:hypothetical protein
MRYLTAINWDGRSTPLADLTNIRLGLKNQSNGATVNHAQAPVPIDDATREAIVDEELALFTAQIIHEDAKNLTANRALGGPLPLLTFPFAFGLNDPFLPGFNPAAMTLYDTWALELPLGTGSVRRRVNAGQAVFNLKPFFTAPDRISTCSTCHSQPNTGAHSSFRLFDIGISSPARRAPNVPLYTLRNKLTGELVSTTDPGRALITGLWSDMNRFKVPSLRGLPARAPYFHDGSARTISEVIDHYQARFNITFLPGERENLILFLETL